MKIFGVFIIFLAMILLINGGFMKYSSTSTTHLTAEEKYVIVNKGTEKPGTGQYLHNNRTGIYVCKRCGAKLYKSEDKFDAHCGWPAFDDEIPGAIKRIPDSDGKRTEIVCAKCNAHLGHVFIGEHLTAKNTRHCVNSISMRFIPTETAIFAGGCFWGVEYFMEQEKGVIDVTSGYIGGTTQAPTYEEVCSHKTGHLEAVKITFNPEETSYEQLLKVFFEIHDFTQTNGQGPDIGNQYLSKIFVTSSEQEKLAKDIIKLLSDKGYKVATTIATATKFWPAEAYHQNYYQRNGSIPYCHKRQKIF